MAALELQKFLSEIKKEGLAQSNRFHVEILPGKSGSIELPYPKKYSYILEGINTSDMPRRIRYFTQSVDTPSRVISSFETPERSFPYGITYEPVDITFKLSGNAAERKVLDLWQMAVIDPETEFIDYQDYYARDIRIKMFNNEGEETYSIDIIDAFPTTSTPLSLDQSSQDELITVTYTFTFRRWKFTEETKIKFNDEFTPSRKTYDLQTEPEGSTVSTEQTRINAKLGEIKDNIKVDGGEELNYYALLATLKAGNPRAELTKGDAKRFLTSVISDIDNTAASVLSSANEEALAVGAQDMINILS